MSDNQRCTGCKEDSGYDIRPIAYHDWARSDIYGIYTGIYCDKCYNDPFIYTYRKDNYHDPAYAGERLDPDE
tara:strand:- start:271 stop:486 length:216 start_codon:yes stop_codon:yes gene_type:complete